MYIYYSIKIKSFAQHKHRKQSIEEKFKTKLTDLKHFISKAALEFSLVFQ